jgi:hypothetical protein
MKRALSTVVVGLVLGLGVISCATHDTYRKTASDGSAQTDRDQPLTLRTTDGTTVQVDTDEAKRALKIKECKDSCTSPRYCDDSGNCSKQD